MSKGKAKGPQTSAEIQADIEARRAELRALGVSEDELAFAGVVARLARATGLKWPDGRDETVWARAVRLRREAAAKAEGPHGPDAA